MNEADKPPGKRPSWHYVLLWAVALTSLALNLFLLVGFHTFRQSVQEEAGRIAGSLADVKIENYEMPVVIDERFDLALTVPFSDTLKVPIKTTVSVSTSVTVDETISVPIKDTVSLDRDVQLVIPIFGQEIPVDVPIRADVPLDLEMAVPIKLEVPVEAEIPIDMVIEVPVNTEVPVAAQVPVQMEFPVTVPLQEMGFGALLEQLREGFAMLGGG